MRACMQMGRRARVGQRGERVVDSRLVEEQLLHLFVHTEVSDEFSGMGLGTRLVRETLEEMRSRGELIVPICPFFVSYLARHPEFEDVVDKEMTDRLNAARAAKDD